MPDTLNAAPTQGLQMNGGALQEEEEEVIMKEEEQDALRD